MRFRNRQPQPRSMVDESVLLMQHLRRLHVELDRFARGSGFDDFLGFAVFYGRGDAGATYPEINFLFEDDGEEAFDVPG